MAGSVNKVILVGNLGKDPDIRTLQSGNRVANLTVATSESWRDKHTNERKEKTEWHRVVIFNDGLAKVAETYLRKGSKVYLEGQLETRKWTDQGGSERYTTEVVLKAYAGTLTLLDKAPSDSRDTSDGAPASRARGADARGRSTEDAPPPQYEFDDEIPF